MWLFWQFNYIYFLHILCILFIYLYSIFCIFGNIHPPRICAPLLGRVFVFSLLSVLKLQIVVMARSLNVSKRETFLKLISHNRNYNNDNNNKFIRYHFLLCFCGFVALVSFAFVSFRFVNLFSALHQKKRRKETKFAKWFHEENIRWILSSCFYSLLCSVRVSKRDSFADQMFRSLSWGFWLRDPRCLLTSNL